MKTFFLILTTSILISACSGSPPKANEPTGKWEQVNSSHYYEENANKVIPTNKGGNNEVF